MKKINKGKLVFAALVLAGALAITSPYLSVDSYTITVQDKQPYENGIYKIWSNSGDVFVIKDSAYFLNFSSSNMYGKMLRGKTYAIRATGFRIGVFSMFENIISVKEVK